MKQRKQARHSKSKLLDRVKYAAIGLLIAAPFLFMIMIKMSPEFSGMGFDKVIETYPVVLISMLRVFIAPFVGFVLYKMDFYKKEPVHEWSVMTSLFILMLALIMASQVYFAGIIVFLIFVYSGKVQLQWRDLKENLGGNFLKKILPSLVVFLGSLLIFIIAKRAGL